MFPMYSCIRCIRGKRSSQRCNSVAKENTKNFICPNGTQRVYMRNDSACAVTWTNSGACNIPCHRNTKETRVPGCKVSKGGLPPQASKAAHLRSGGATAPAVPSGSRGAQAVRLAHRSRSFENRPGLTQRTSQKVKMQPGFASINYDTGLSSTSQGSIHPPPMTKDVRNLLRRQGKASNKVHASTLLHNFEDEANTICLVVEHAVIYHATISEIVHGRSIELITKPSAEPRQGSIAPVRGSTGAQGQLMPVLPSMLRGFHGKLNGCICHDLCLCTCGVSFTDL